MKVAIIHDHLLYLGGAERVLFTLLNIFPQADIYTFLITKNNLIEIQKLTTGKIFSSRFNLIPIITCNFADWFKLIIYSYWESLDLSRYDLVISSSHSFSSKSVITSPNSLHIAYIYTTPKYLYSEFNETRQIKSGLTKIFISPLLSYLRLEDFISAQRADILIANSFTVKKRIQKYYRRDSVVLFPPIKLPDKNIRNKKGEFFIIVSRLVKQKGIDLAIKACNELKLPLIIIGEGKEENYLKSIAGTTIQFKGYLNDAEISTAYSKAKALIYCSRDEDFGLVPVEAMAHGIPVIAYNSGGVSETVVNNKTGILINEYTQEALIKALVNFNNINLSSYDCHKQASKFSENNFTSKFKNLVFNNIKNI
jgi:glycosyltransferase involved in cell wall biosynthesis